MLHLDFERGEIFAKVEGEEGAPTGFEGRLLEALRFGTATMFWPVMQETCHDGKIVLELSRHRSSPRGGMIAPPVGRDASGEDFYRLLSCYYVYSCATTDSDAVDPAAPLSKKLAGLYTIKDVWIDSVALLVSVALEATLGESDFKTIGQPDPAFLKQVDAILASVKNTEGVEEDLTKRAIGALGGLKSSRAIDKLYFLRSIGAISQTEASSWKSLRDRAAHGSLRIKPKELQKLIDQIYSTVSAIYKIAFIQIGYKGGHTVYSKHGWPMEVFDGLHYKNAIQAANSPAGQVGPTQPTQAPGPYLADTSIAALDATSAALPCSPSQPGSAPQSPGW